jgi:hypothetical protein
VVFLGFTVFTSFFLLKAGVETPSPAVEAASPP